MSTNNTARRRLEVDFKQRRPPSQRVPRLSPSSEVFDVLTPGALKTCLEFYKAANIPMVQEQEQDEANLAEIRHLVAQGPPTEHGDKYAAIVRDSLSRQVDKQLRAYRWLFHGMEDVLP